MPKSKVILPDGNPAFDYDSHGGKYSGIRRADPRIAKYVHTALGDAETVLNVGAGAGSYEPEDRYVIALEPSKVMRSQRPTGKVPAVIGTAEKLPFDDNSFDASMAMLTVHHWQDMPAGLRELRRVTRGPVVIMNFDPDAVGDFWLAEYAPEVIEADLLRYPKMDFIAGILGGKSTVQAVPIPFDCTDGFQEAFYGRPEAFLDAEVRKSQSAWGFVPEDALKRIIKELTRDLESGEWDKRYGHLRSQPEYTCALRIITACP